MYRIAVRLYPLNADVHYELGNLLIDRLGASRSPECSASWGISMRPSGSIGRSSKSIRRPQRGSQCRSRLSAPGGRHEP